MHRSARWVAIAASVASLALVAASLAPVANADSPNHGHGKDKGSNSQQSQNGSQNSFILNEMSKMTGWGNIIGKLESTVQKQGHEIAQLQQVVVTQQTELDTVMAQLGISAPGQGQENSVSGTVTAVSQPSGSTLGSITIQPSTGSPQTLEVASNAQLTNASGATITLAQVAVNDMVQATLSDGVITALTDSGQAAGVSTTFSGSVASFTAPNTGSSGSITVAPTTGSAQTFVVPFTVTLSSSSGGSVSLSDITQGTQVTVTEQSGTASAIEITGQAQTSVLGAVMSFTAPVGTTPGTLVLLPTGSTTAQQYLIPAATPVVQGSTPSSFSALTINTQVELTLQNGVVTEIDILQ